jgi:hypothetical protein
MLTASSPLTSDYYVGSPLLFDILYYKTKFDVVMTVHFGMKLYNDQRNAQVFNLSIHFCLTSFGLSLSPSSEAGLQIRQWFKSPGYDVSIPRRLEPRRICTPASEDDLKESPKHVRQK